MLELAAYAQITEAADLNQQERQQRQAECDIDICSDRPDPKQPQRASDQDIKEDRSHIRRESFRFAAEIALGIIVDFFDNQLCGNLPFGRRNRFQPVPHPDAERRNDHRDDEAPEDALTQKNTSVSEADDDTRTQLVYIDHTSSTPFHSDSSAIWNILLGLSKKP